MAQKVGAEGQGAMSHPRRSPVLRLLRPGKGVLFDGLVVCIEGRFEEENSGDTPSHFLDVAHFSSYERAAKKKALRGKSR